jgi:CheY-like chemotaxis protein
VLVVDDDLVLQDLFQTFLKKIGFSRVVVGTAKEAIKSLRKQKFDLMFLDLQLPDAPGDQVYQTAKQIDPDLNVIVITGYPDSEILDRILQVCPVTVLKKPLKIEQLYQTVKMLGTAAQAGDSSNKVRGFSWGSNVASWSPGSRRLLADYVNDAGSLLSKTIFDGVMRVIAIDNDCAQ